VLKLDLLRSGIKRSYTRIEEILNQEAIREILHQEYVDLLI
jgi:transposase